MPAFLLPILLKGFGFVKKAAQALWNVATRYPWQTAALLLLALSVWLWRANNGLHDKLDAERAAHAKTVKNFRDAQAKAELAQKANLARVSIQQRNITDEALDDYNRRVADLHARYDRLRTKGNRSASGNAGMPAVSDTASRVDEAPGENGLPAPDALIASEQALQLDALINWVEAQSKVDTSPENQK